MLIREKWLSTENLFFLLYLMVCTFFGHFNSINWVFFAITCGFHTKTCWYKKVSSFFSQFNIFLAILFFPKISSSTIMITSSTKNHYFFKWVHYEKKKKMKSCAKNWNDWKTSFWCFWMTPNWLFVLVYSSKMHSFIDWIVV